MKKGWQIVLIVFLLVFSIVLCNTAARNVDSEMRSALESEEGSTSKTASVDEIGSTSAVESLTEEDSEITSASEIGKESDTTMPDLKEEGKTEITMNPDPNNATTTRQEIIPEPEKVPEPEADEDPDKKSEWDKPIEPEAVPEPEGDTDPEVESETESIKELQTEPLTDTQPDSTSESESESKSESESESEPESEADEKDQKKDDQKAVYEYDEDGEIIGKTVDGVWYIWDDDYGYREGIRLNEDRKLDADAVHEKKAGIQMTSVLQLPDMPTGCEIVSTFMVLKHFDFSISLLKFTTEYFKNEEKSADFRHYFVGDPYTPYGLGCYAPCVVSAVNAYMKDCKSEYLAYNYTGYTFESLLNQVAEGYPVIFWGTQYMREPFLSTYFQAGDDTLRWISQEHCMVMTGYDLEKGFATVYDPLAGIVQYDLNKLKGRFLQLGSQAVIIKEADIGYDPKNKPGAFLYDPNIPKQ